MCVCVFSLSPNVLACTCTLTNGQVGDEEVGDCSQRLEAVDDVDDERVAEDAEHDDGAVGENQNHLVERASDQGAELQVRCLTVAQPLLSPSPFHVGIISFMRVAMIFSHSFFEQCSFTVSNKRTAPPPGHSAV